MATSIVGARAPSRIFFVRITRKAEATAVLIVAVTLAIAALVAAVWGAR